MSDSSTNLPSVDDDGRPPAGAGRAIATIDVGTNTTLLLVARAGAATDRGDGRGRPPDVLEDDAEITRLGRGIGGDGRLGREGIDRTLAALTRYAESARRHHAQIAAVGTEALRRAPNAHEFLTAAREILGVPVEVIAGDREAALTFRATAESFPDDVGQGRVMVVDIGGGSTEIVVADRGHVSFRRSLPLGSVRLHERHVHADPPAAGDLAAIENDVEATLDSVHGAFSGTVVDLLVGVAGTVTSLAAMVLELASYDPGRVHGFVLSRDALDAQIARLAGATQTQRERIVGLDPRRADVILAGALLLRGIVRRAATPALRVSDRGIRWGLYYERAAAD